MNFGNLSVQTTKTKQNRTITMPTHTTVSVQLLTESPKLGHEANKLHCLCTKWDVFVH